MDRKELVRKYKETPRPAGNWRVRHIASGRSLVGSSPDAPAMLNRIRAQLRLKAHRNRALQRDWDEGGADAFELEVLDLLPPPETPDQDIAEDLKVLEAMWVEKLGLTEETRY